MSESGVWISNYLTDLELKLSISIKKPNKIILLGFCYFDFLAGACANRTHQTQDRYVSTGFEVQAGHQTRSAPLYLQEQLYHK